MTLHRNKKDISELLNGMSNVSSFEIDSDQEICSVQMNITGETTSVVAELVSNGVGISRVLNSTSELEQTFLSLTQGGKQ